MTEDQIRETLRTFVLQSFLPGEPAESLQASTPLISSGVITSLSMLELVGFIEDRFGVELAPDDLAVANMDSLDLLVKLVVQRRAQP